jgi:hypothetical protein
VFLLERRPQCMSAPEGVPAGVTPVTKRGDPAVRDLG